MTATSRDLIGEWFSALEENGEYLTFRLGRYCAGMRDPEWFFLPHDRYDGLGGLAHVLRSQFDDAIELPQSTETPPTRWETLLAALYSLFRRRSQPMRWRDENPSFRSGSAAEVKPSAFAWALFSSEETEALRETARRHEVSLNAWLLWGLTRSSLPRLLPGTGDVQWIVPVNLRGLVKSRRDTENVAWALDVAFRADAGPEGVHAAIAEQLRKKAHWGSRALFELLRYFGPNALRAVARRELQVRKHGSFSNLGRLEPSRTTAARPPEEWWMAYNPVLCSRPVGAACLTWRGRLALTLQLHPGLSCEPREAREWLERWITSVFVQPNNVRTRSSAGTVTDSPSRGGTNRT